MAELANAFLRPTGKNAFEVLDPSVIDLLNAVIRKAPENAIDLVLGAVDFSQVERGVGDRQGRRTGHYDGTYPGRCAGRRGYQEQG